MDLLIKGSTELNKMFAALQNTAAGLRHDFGEVEELQQSLRSAHAAVPSPPWCCSASPHEASSGTAPRCLPAGHTAREGIPR